MSQNEPASAAPRSRRDWDGVAAVIAACVGLLALCVSGYTAWLTRQQVSAQVWPHLITATTSSDKEHDFLVVNKGVGPAIVRSVQVFVDGQPKRTWDDVFAAVDLKFDSTQVNSSTVNQNVISAGELLHALTFTRGEDFLSFVAKSDRIKERICYCSVLDECWLIDKREKAPSRREQRVAECVRDDAKELHDYSE